MGEYVYYGPEFEGYFDELVERVDNKKVDAYDYTLLLGYLFAREFTWLIPMDENRAEDGLGLRYEHGLHDSYDHKPCSVLEVLIALSVNWEHEITYDFKKGDRSSDWFWEMLDNLGLLNYPDYRFDRENVEEIVDIFLNRTYQKNGEGGIFPLKTGINDQRKCELWIQLQNYLLENW